MKSDNFLKPDDESYNVEAKYLYSLLEYTEQELDKSLTEFLNNPEKNEFHVLTNKIIIFINKLSRSTRIKQPFLDDIDTDFKKISVKLEKDKTLPKTDLFKILSKVNAVVSGAGLFTKHDISRRDDKIEKAEELDD